MKILDYLNPKNVFDSIQGMIVEKIHYKKYVAILEELVAEKKIQDRIYCQHTAIRMLLINYYLRQAFTL